MVIEVQIAYAKFLLFHVAVVQDGGDHFVGDSLQLAPFFGVLLVLFLDLKESNLASSAVIEMVKIKMAVDEPWIFARWLSRVHFQI